MAFLTPQLPTQRVEVGKADNFPLSSSEYGKEIPVGAGTFRTSGNIIWTSGIRRETEVERTTTGGKGGQPEQTTETVSYFYYADIAIAFCEGPTEGILRVWADGKLVYSTVGGYLEANAPAQVRFYNGSETQLPDELIENDIGENDTPAYRGLCYVVIENLLLSDFGNRIPAIEAEIVFEGTDPGDVEPLETTVIDLPEAVSSNVVVDYERDRVYFQTSSFEDAMQVSETTVYVYRLSDLAPLSSFPITDPDYRIAYIFPKTGEIGVVHYDTDNGDQPKSALVNQFTGEITLEYSTGNDNVANVPVAASRIFGGKLSHVMISNDRQNKRLRFHTGLDLRPVDSKSTTGMWGVPTVTETNVAYVIDYEGSSDIEIYRIDIDGHDDLYETSDFGIRVDNVVQYEPDDFGMSGFENYENNPSRIPVSVWDPTTQSLLFVLQESSAGGWYAVRWSEEEGIIWTTEINVRPPQGITRENFPVSRIAGGKWSFLDLTGRVVAIDIGTGAVDATLNGSSALVDTNSADTQFFDGSQNALYHLTDAGTTFTRHLLGGIYQANAVPIVNFIKDMFDRTGFRRVIDYNLADFDSDLNISGILIDKQTSIRGALQQVTDAFFLECVEEDNALKFVALGQDPVLTITEDEILRTSSGVYSADRSQEIDLPSKVSIEFLDPANFYQTSIQFAERYLTTVPTIKAGKEMSIAAKNLALTVDQGRQAAEKSLFTAWAQRETLKFRLGPKYIGLSPSDVINLSIDGFTRQLRAQRTLVGGDFSIELRTLEQVEDQFVSDAVGESGNAVQTELGGAAGPSELFLFDIPYVVDEDASSTVSQFYWAGSSYETGDWPGATLQNSVDDGATFENVATTANAAAWGFTTGTIGSPQSPWVTDTVNSITVNVVRGIEQFASVTKRQMLDGANRAIIIGVDGPEIIQFQTVEVLSETQVRLTNLLRGRRGTENFTGPHTTSRTFMLLNGVTQRVQRSTGTLNSARIYRLPTSGSDPARASQRSFTHTGRDLKPYAPVHVTATDDSGDVVLEWVRRTRYGGSLRDGTGTVPLNEDTEAYEVDILANDDTVIRTLSGLTSATATYTNADRVTDGTENDTTIRVRVYQLSADVGRGFARTDVLEIE